mmetsp:Transcript_21557/g.66822  ORF Transcript_21557/g.66822 Transcript_21557/m.66822 type:complete len:191 (+) Transcript_21557:77-649(+)
MEDGQSPPTSQPRMTAFSKRSNTATSLFSSGSGRSRSRGLTQKFTGHLDLDGSGDLGGDVRGGLLLFSLDGLPLGRADLTDSFRMSSRHAMEWQPKVFLDYLSQDLGFPVTMVFYKVRDRKKGTGHEVLRFAQLGVDDLSPQWPFVPGMQIFIGSPGDVGRRPSVREGSMSSMANQPGPASDNKAVCALM